MFVWTILFGQSSSTNSKMHKNSQNICISAKNVVSLQAELINDVLINGESVISNRAAADSGAAAVGGCDIPDG